MRSRPVVELRMPRAIGPGQELRVSLKLTATAETPIRAVKLSLEGREITRSAPHEDARSSVVDFLRHGLTLAPDGQIGPGSSTYQASFILPANAPPTYLGALVEHRYSVKVHVEIPWWFDVEESYEIIVHPSLTPRPRPRSYVGTSAKGSEPFIEVSLANQEYAPGDVIDGGVAFGNLRGRTPRGLDLSLVGYEKIARDDIVFPPQPPEARAGVPAPPVATSARFVMSEAAEAHRFTALKSVEGAVEGHEVPFRFAIPADAPPALATSRAQLFWVFEARLDLRGGPSVILHTPLTLKRFDSPASPGAARRAVGAGRWRAVWSEAGATSGLTLDPVDLALAGVIDGASVAVRAGDAAASGGGLVAELDYPSLGLGLSIKSHSVLALGITLDDQPFGARFRARGRDKQQTRVALTSRLRAALGQFDDVAVTDAHARVKERAPGYDQPFIGRFVDHVRELAAAIAEASAAIPPPPSMAELLPDFRRLAESLGGRLEVGSLSVLDARFDGERVALITEFGRTALPERTVLTLALDAPLTRALDLGAEDADGSASPGSVPPTRGGETRALVTELGRLGRSLAVTEHAIRLELPAPLEDLSLAREALAAMVALAEAARRERRVGPYR
jgi:hypothetical protein